MGYKPSPQQPESDDMELQAPPEETENQDSNLDMENEIDAILKEVKIDVGDDIEIEDMPTGDEQTKKDFEKKILTSGCKVKFKFKVKANGFIEKPIYTIKIRDPKGQIMYGNNSKYMKIESENLNSGDLVSIVFTMSLNLGAGKYLVSVGLTRFENEELKVIHRKHDCMDFEVVTLDNSFGVSNFFADLEIKKYFCD